MYVFKFKRGWILREEQPADGGDSGTGGADGGTPDFDLGSAMDAIAKEMSASEEPAAPAPAPGTPASQTGAVQATATAPAPAPAAAEGQTSPPATPAADAPPKTWKADVSTAHWATLAPEVKAEIHRREEDFHRGIEQYKADAGFGKSVQAVLNPYMPILQQYNIDPVQQFQNLMGAHYTLSFGHPDQKVALIKSIIQDYRIDPKSLGFEAASGEPAYTDPQVAALQAELAAVNSKLQQVTSGVAQARQNEILKEVEAFAKDPANEFFEKVSPEIATIVKADKSITLKEAYDRAIWLNPEVRATLIERQKKADAERKAQEQREHAAKAATARAANVSPAPRPASATAPTGSIEDTMKETLAAIKARG